jgi:hypothetical protein
MGNFVTLESKLLEDGFKLFKRQPQNGIKVFEKTSAGNRILTSVGLDGKEIKTVTGKSSNNCQDIFTTRTTYPNGNTVTLEKTINTFDSGRVESIEHRAIKTYADKPLNTMKFYQRYKPDKRLDFASLVRNTLTKKKGQLVNYFSDNIYLSGVNSLKPELESNRYFPEGFSIACPDYPYKSINIEVTRPIKIFKGMAEIFRNS